MSKNLYYHLIIYSPKYPETKGHPSNPKTPLYHIPLQGGGGGLAIKAHTGSHKKVSAVLNSKM